MSVKDLLGMKVMSSYFLPDDMVLFCRNGEVLQRFVWMANALRALAEGRGDR